MTAPAHAEARVSAFGTDAKRLTTEIAKVIVGNREIVEGVFTCLLAGGHALLEGVPGLGKTMLVRTMARTMDLHFSRVQFTPDLMPADILGTTVVSEDAHGKKTFEFRRGPLFAHMVLADEINRATPKTQSALLEAMQEQSVTVAKETYPLEPPFVVLATQNPIEMEGTYPLPEAQLDRFLLKLHVRFPDSQELHAILDRTTGAAEPDVEKVLSRERLLEMRGVVREVAVARPVQEYVVQILQGTHPDTASAPEPTKKFVRFGASPRGAQAVLLAAKVRALLGGRFAASSADVRECVKPALRHRIILNFEGEAEGVTTDQVIDDVLARVSEAKG